MLPGSAPDDTDALGMAQAAAAAMGMPVAAVSSDCAYGDGENRKGFRKAGLSYCQGAGAAIPGGALSQARFQIDLVGNSYTCPAGPPPRKSGPWAGAGERI